MRRFYLLGFALLVLCDALAQISFKYTALGALPLEPGPDWLLRVLSQPWIYIALGAYLATFFIWMALLQHAPIGPAFAVSHLEVVVVMLLAVPLFGERIAPLHLLGAAAILAGIACLAVSEGREAGQRGRRATDAAHTKAA